MHESLLSPSTAWALLQDRRIQVIDLRERDEAALPRIPGTRAIPLDELPGELPALDRERPVVFVSGTGRRAAEAMKVLRAAGMTASAIQGGMRAWRDAGLPIESDGAQASPRAA